MSETFQLPRPMIANAAVGMASPLWGYFAGVAMGGVAFWWAMKAVQPASYQALAARLPQPGPALPEATAAADVPFVPMAEAVSSEPLDAAEAAPEPEPLPVANDVTADAKSA